MFSMTHSTARSASALVVFRTSWTLLMMSALFIVMDINELLMVASDRLDRACHDRWLKNIIYQGFSSAITSCSE